MKNVLRTLSLALTVGLFLNAATPANAQFFPEPFQPGCRAVPVKTQEAQPAPEKQMLEIKTANPTIKKDNPDQQFTEPLSNPTPYRPMGQLEKTTSPTTLQATPPIAVLVHATMPTLDPWFSPSVNSNPTEPMR